MDEPTSSEVTSEPDDPRVPARGAAAPAEALYLDVEQTAAALQLNRGTIYKMLADGSLPHFRVGRLVRILRRAVESGLISSRTGRPTRRQGSES